MEHTHPVCTFCLASSSPVPGCRRECLNCRERGGERGREREGLGGRELSRRVTHIVLPHLPPSQALGSCHFFSSGPPRPRTTPARALHLHSHFLLRAVRSVAESVTSHLSGSVSRGSSSGTACQRAASRPLWAVRSDCSCLSQNPQCVTMHGRRRKVLLRWTGAICPRIRSALLRTGGGAKFFRVGLELFVPESAVRCSAPATEQSSFALDRSCLSQNPQCVTLQRWRSKVLSRSAANHDTNRHQLNNNNNSKSFFLFKVFSR